MTTLQQQSKHPDWDELCVNLDKDLNWLRNYVKSHDINQCTDEYGNTLLHHAVQNCDDNAILNLNNFFIDPNIKNTAGQTALQLAQDIDDEDLIETLRYHQLCIDFTKASSQPNGKDALFAAIYRGDTTIAGIFDSNRVDEEEDHCDSNSVWTFFHCAAMYGRAQLIHELYQLFPHADINNDMNGCNVTALQLATKLGHQNCIIALSECFDTIHEDDQYCALQVACEFNRTACITTLCMCFPHIVTFEDATSDYYFPAIVQSVQSNNPECIRTLHSCFPHIDSNVINENASLAFDLAFSKSLDCISALCECFPNIDLDDQDHDGNTSLMTIVKQGFSHAIPLFATYFPTTNVNIRNNRGQTALIMAVENRDETNLCALCEAFSGINPNIQDRWGNTALMLAVSSRCAERFILQLLNVFPNIDLNIQNNKQETALMLILASNSKFVGLLLRRVLTLPNIDINIRNSQGDTALIVAIRHDHTYAIHLLMNCFPNIDLNYYKDGIHSTGQNVLVLAINIHRLDSLSKLLQQLIKID